MMMMMICCGTRLSGLRVVDGSCRFVSTTTSTSTLLGPPEIGHDLGPSVKFTKPRFERPRQKLPSPQSWQALFRNCTLGLLENHHYMNCVLGESWKDDPLNTLRVIGYMKQIRYDSGDITLSQRRNEQFYTAALWLHAHHPETLVRNVRAFSRIGSLRDFPEILHRLVRGPFVRQAEKLERMRLRRQQSRRLLGIERWCLTDDDEQAEDVEVFDVLGSREEKRIRQARQAVEMYNSDPRYRSLHDAVSDLFAELLKSDLELLRSGELQKLSLASKWCPSLGSSYDRSTLLCEGIARRLFPYDGSSYRGVEDAHYAYRVRDRLRREVLVPLRRALELPKIYMSNKQWNLLPYSRVSPAAMRTYERLFMKHDRSRFLQYVNANKLRKETLSWLPHEICSLSDSQWRRIVETFSEQGKFKNCIVTCDWSVIEYLPKPKLVWDFSLSFQLLASELSDDPWKGKFLRQTGDHVAEFVNIEVDELQPKIQCLKALAISSRDLCVWTLLDKILETAVSGKVSQENMVKRLFLLSSCYYLFVPQSCPEIQKARTKFERCGYMMPDLVYWRINKGCFKIFAHIYSSDNGGTTRIEGISPSCFRVFMEKDGKLEEDAVMEAEISGAKYMELKVFD